MKRLPFTSAMIAIGAFCLIAAGFAAAQAQQILHATQGASAASSHPLQLNRMTAEGRQVHIKPTHEQVKGLAAIGYQHNGGTPPLLYNGGPVMHNPTVYVIYWIPPQLQDGTLTSLSSKYQSIQTTMLKEYFGHSLMNNNTQYHDTTYITNTGRVGGTYVDKSLYPGSDCFDPATVLTNGNNCISDADLQNEITKVMGLKLWTGGVNKLFMVFTSFNEGQCTVSNSDCSYSTYCGYHGFFTNASLQDVVYANLPYGDATACQLPGVPSPNSFPQADTAADTASHELSEAITDPLLNAWFDSSGSEIGDECAYSFGVALWDGGLANEQWDGHPYYLQTEYSNLAQSYYLTDSNFTGCFNTGPEL
jgi:hypothetical protein